MSPAQPSVVVAEALSWLGTPFHHRARVKGVGVDCVNLLVAVYTSSGLIADLALDYYAPDWHLHQDEPRFLKSLALYADRLPAGEIPQPGDIAMFSYGRHAAHGAIVTAWPTVVHAWLDARSVVLSDATASPLADRLDSLWRLKGGV